MGFDGIRFSGDIDEEFQCSICQDIIEDPIATQCEHVFCKICINEWLQTKTSCPVDRKYLNVSQLCEPSRFFRNFYSKLVLKCKFESNGCENKLKIEDLKSHESKCKFNPIVKHLCENGCEASLTLNESRKHNCVQYLKSIIGKIKDELEKSNKRELEQEEIIRDLQTMLSTQSDKIKNLKEKIDLTTNASSSRESMIKEILRYTPLDVSSTAATFGQKRLVELLKNKGRIKKSSVELVFLSVDRGLFCSTNPYTDEARGIGFGSTINAPHIDASILELFDDYLHQSNYKSISVLDIGSGSGYLTICMARLVGPYGRVIIGVDHVEQLIDTSKKILEKKFFYLSDRIEFVVSDGRNGYSPGAPYDVINIGGAITKVPKIICDQLKIGGQIIAPMCINGIQRLVTINKLENGSMSYTSHFNVSFGRLKDLHTQLWG